MWIRRADPTCLRGERRWHWTSFSQKGFCMHLTQNKPKILQCQCPAVVKEKQEVGFRSKLLRHCRDRAVQTRSEGLRGQLTDGLHLSWESREPRTGWKTFGIFLFLIMRTPCVVSQGGRWHRIMKLNSSCHESCLNLKTRQSPGDWTVSYAQLLECHQITLFFPEGKWGFCTKSGCCYCDTQMIQQHHEKLALTIVKSKVWLKHFWIDHKLC